jgi:hypothetical protein
LGALASTGVPVVSGTEELTPLFGVQCTKYSDMKAMIPNLYMIKKFDSI